MVDISAVDAVGYRSTATCALVSVEEDKWAARARDAMMVTEAVGAVGHKRRANLAL